MTVYDDDDDDGDDGDYYYSYYTLYHTITGRYEASPSLVAPILCFKTPIHAMSWMINGCSFPGISLIDSNRCYIDIICSTMSEHL